MAIRRILITNLTAAPVSLDLLFSPSVQFRTSLAVGASTDVGAVATWEQVNMEPRLRAMRTGSSPKVSVALDPGTDDLAGMSTLVSRYAVQADSVLTADVIGAATEAIHTGITLTAADLSVARRLVRFYARLRVLAANSTDTWTFRLRLGGLTGTQLLSSAAIDIVTNDVYTFEGYAEVRTLGATGTFASATRFTDVVNAGAGSKTQAVTAGTVNTLTSEVLVVTGQCSTNNAGNQVSLQHFSAEVLRA